MDEEAKRKIGLFRFSLIAPLLNHTFKESTALAYIEEICARAYDVPVYGTKEYAPETIKGWLLDYRKHGIEGLYPLTRSDKGKSRSLSEEVKQYIPLHSPGEGVKVRYDPSSLDRAYIFDDNGNCLHTVYPVNKINNSKVIRDLAKKAADFSSFNAVEVTE